MSADEVTVVPKYKLGFRIAFFILPFVCLVMLWAAIDGGRKDPGLYGGLIFVVLTPFLWLRTYRRIRFGSSITLERYIFPPRVIEYSSITDVGTGMLKTRQGNIAFTDRNCLNIDEIDRAVEESRRRGLWSETQIEGKLALQQVAASKAATIALPVSLAAAFGATLLEPGGLQLRFMIWFLIFFVPINVGLYYYLKRRETSGRQP